MTQEDRIEAHQYRQVAESFGVDPGPDVLDVGCGTGIAARQFRAAGCRVLGVEPDARMADFARRTGIEVEVATFEAWDSAGRTFDAVVAGQAWHWVDPVAGAAQAARVLRPGGRLAAFWHVFEPPQDVAQAAVAVYQRVMPDSPFNYRVSPQQTDRTATLFTTRAADGRVRRRGAVAVRLGAELYPGRVAGPAGLVGRRHPAPAGQAGGSAGGDRRRARRDGRRLHGEHGHGGGRRGASRRTTIGECLILRLVRCT